MCAFQPRPEPFRIEPIFSPRIWGSRSLAPLFPEKSNLPEPIGEAWLTGLDCRIGSGPFAGKTLGQTWPELTPAWRGTRLRDESAFPLLLKFIFPKEKLSIQVHPDDAYAVAHERDAGGRGKTEMWHIVSAEPGARLLAGLKPGTTKEEFRAALADHTLENLFQSHEVRAGDTFFLPAGTPHTIGPGMIVCEVQQYSDLTYRVYDYGRVDANGKQRELHIEKALDAIRFGESSTVKAHPIPLRRNAPMRMLLAACRYFAAERWEISAAIEAESEPACFCLFAILAGRGKFQWPSGAANYEPGECWFSPATPQVLSIQPSERTTLVRAYVPDTSALRSCLKKQSVPQEAISQAVFD